MDEDLIYKYELLLTDIEYTIYNKNLSHKEKKKYIDILFENSSSWRKLEWN